ncbi:Tr-type G domain-containing protein [Caenorhabditis elegans]|uniref:Tr-type G domain-containing protein n=2 Tax=Caenorhabditis elegans TaxID=6239 RepID=O45622_CAEEL|nr:Tr-type G domain-containing protein [Caenorhabditis elegans]CAB07395.2 Tr-type G domain-containing protein [Caenorhabditis elegans]|eukprot:NP_001256292.1 Eukaryotic Release FActor homolog [Caenorhabditis elegans]
MSGWNVNASSFVPNANARPFVPGQPYTPQPEQAAPEPTEDWEAQADTSPAAVQPEVAEPVAVQESAPVAPVSATEAPKKEPTPEEDLVAPLAKKFQRTVYVDDGTHKEHINMVFVGHVDAGKSTIGGQLMFLTGMVDKRTLEKYEREAKEKGRESWYLSWCMDTNDEEREKGKTVEVGRAYFETEKRHFTILDAPGHKSFVPNMIVGANQADLAVLVISARRGEFETGFDRGGQTREHSMLVKTAGVKHLVILVNKMDDPTVKWEEERFKEIEGKLTPFLRKLGFNPKTDITYVPCSGLTGAFIKDRPTGSEGNWYSGPCFIEFIDVLLPSYKRDFNGPVRCTVAEKYSEMGTVIIGKMESGCVQKGDTLVVMPNKQPVQVLQIWADDVETERVVAGDNIKFKLKGIEENELQGGFIICSPDSLAKTGRVFDAEVLVLEHRSIIASGYSCVLHIQSAVEEVTVKGVIATIDKKTGEKKRAKFVKQDEKCIMRLESPEPFVLEPFKEYPYLGRFTLRDEGKTIAIGKVLKVVE